MIRQRGFTLVELMVALTISIILLGLLYRGVSQSLQQWKRTDSINRNYQHWMQGRDHLRRQLRQALAIKDANGHPLFVGNEQQLSFISYISHPTHGGLYRHQLLAHADRSERLMLEISRHQDTQPEQAPLEKLELYNGPAPLQLRYGKRNHQGELHWQSTWQQGGLPALVKLSLPAPSDGDSWPELVIELRNQSNER